MNTNEMIAVYPGTFDPITVGHIDIVQRASNIFSEVIVAISENPHKNTTFSPEERSEMVFSSLSDINNIKIEVFSTLAVEFTTAKKSRIIIRGLRALSDYEYEIQMASVNHQLNQSVETIFLSSAKDYTNISSSLVKQIAYYGGDISNFVHPSIISKITKLSRV